MKNNSIYIKILTGIVVVLTVLISAMIVLKEDTKSSYESNMLIKRDELAVAEPEQPKETDEDLAEQNTEANETSQGEQENSAQNQAQQIYASVEDSYFEDAVFVGDSRTEGFNLNSGLTYGTTYAGKGLDVKNIYTNKLIMVDGKKVPITEALAANKFKKVYIMLGVNELGWAYEDVFISKYKQLIEEIKGWQPEAVVYVQSIIHVTGNCQENSDYLKNDKIDQYNEHIKKMTEESNVYYLDLNEIFTDSDGNLQADASADGVHLKASYCKKWLEYLKGHAIVAE